MSICVFRFLMSKNLEILVVSVDSKYVQVMKRKVRFYRLRKENMLSTLIFKLLILVCAVADTLLYTVDAKIAFHSLSLKGSL